MTKICPKILVIDDTPANVKLLGEALGSEYELVFALSGTVGLTVAAQVPRPDLILLDVLMPYMDGYETCIRFKNDRYLRDIPIIFVTALSDSMDESRGLSLGAADYITKPINFKIAKLRIRNLLERERQRREIQFYRDRLAAIVRENQAIATAQYHGIYAEKIADCDPLTEVANSGSLLHCLIKTIAHAQQFNSMLAVCHLDLNGVKPISNQLEPDSEAPLLRAIIYRLSTILRQCDRLINLDGYKFVLLLNNIEREMDCYNMFERVLTTLGMPFTVDNKSIALFPSLGVAFYPRGDDNAEALLCHSDRALYQAKNTGTSCFVVYTANSSDIDKM